MANILIVDDRPANRELVVTLLGYVGHRLLEASTGEEGLALAKAERPDLIIADIVMPTMDGYEFARQVRADPNISQTQIVFYTSSYVVAETRHLAEACGVAYVISKPIEPEAFLKTIQEALNTKPVPSVPAGEDFHRQHMRMLTDSLSRKVDELESEIVERKQAEARLRLQGAALDAAANAIMITDHIGRIIWINLAFTALTGYAAEEVIGQNPRLLNSGLQTPEFYQQLWATIMARQVWRAETINRRKDGSLYTQEQTITPLLDEHGQITHFIAIQQDITERKLTEAALQKEKARVQQYLDIAGIMFLVLAADQTVRIINKMGCEMLGYQEEEIVGRNWFDHFLPQLDRERVRASFDQLMAGRIEQVERFENPILTKSGQERLIAWRNTQLLDETGRIIGAVSSGEDITERRQAETALETAHHQLKSLFDNLDEVFFSADTTQPHWQVLLVSPACEKVYGYPPEAFLNNSYLWQEVIHPDDRSRVDADFSKWNAGEATVTEYRIIRADRESRWVETKAKPTLGPAGQLVRLDGVVADITNRKKAEEQIRQQIEHLAALRAIDTAITGSLDLPFTLAVLLDQVIAQLKVDAADVLKLNRFSGSLEYVTGRGFRSNAVQSSLMRLGEGTAGRAAAERRVIQLPNLTIGSPVFARKELITSEGFQAYYAVPLIAKGVVKGVLEVFHRTPLKVAPEWLDFLETLGGQAAIAIDNAELFTELQHSNSQLILAYDATIEGWSRALDLRDKETEGHTQRVTELTVTLARAFGFNEEKLVQVRRGALLHDIGKMGVPDQILLKPGPLTDDEWIIMRKHPEYAHQMLSPIAYLRPALDIPYSHHEKWDGTGYPRGLQGEQIPLAARLFAVVDVWDALRSDRPYRPGWPEEKVLEHIQRGVGRHFDPQVVDAFLTLLQSQR